MRGAISLAVGLLAGLFAAVECAVFYALGTYLLGWTVTWPVVGAVFWTTSAFWGKYMRDDLKKEGIL